MRLNELGQPIGEPVNGWTGAAAPAAEVLQGRWCRLEPLSAESHGAELHAAWSADRENRVWTYLAYGPFAEEAECIAFLKTMEGKADPMMFAIIDQASGKAMGVGSYLRVEPATGCIEVGHLNFAPALQRTPLATEAMYLMMRHAFEGLGFRRYEWKCDDLNAPSRAAAARLGFTFEGIFRQATVYKGRNRDTAWFSILAKEWPRLRAGFEAWLSPENFDADGRQKRSLVECRGD